VEAICQGLPEFGGSAIETGKLAAADEATKKKEVIKARKKVNCSGLLLQYCIFELLNH